LSKLRITGFTKQGVRDLNGVPGKSLVIAAASDDVYRMNRGLSPEKKEEFIATVDPEHFEPKGIHDLMYDYVEEDIKKQFPNAKCTEEDDWIKGHRTEVDIPNISTWTWYCFLVRTGMAVISLTFQIHLLGGTSESKSKGLLEAVMDEAKPGWRERIIAKRKPDERR